MSVTIDEARDMRRKLERDILLLVADFEADSQLSAVGVVVHRSHVIGGRSVVASIDVEARLEV